MRLLVILYLFSLPLHALNYNNMFISKERTNSYSSILENPELEKEAYYNTVEDSGESGGKRDIRYQVHLALLRQNGYADDGNAIIFTAIKDYSKMFPEYKGVFGQADLLYTFNSLTSEDGSKIKDDIAVSAYGGYRRHMDKRLSISARMGGSFLTGSSSFSLSYGVGATYDPLIPGYLFVANVLRIEHLYVVSVGAQFLF